MPFETGGRADKQGNKYEINCIIFELLKVIEETNYSICIEGLGNDEFGTDIIVTKSDRTKEYQQCKARNGSLDKWNIGNFKRLNLLKTWKLQLSRDSDSSVALVSPLACTFLFDLNKRALNSNGSADDFITAQIEKSSKSFQKFYYDICDALELDTRKKEDVEKSIDYLKRILYKQLPEYGLDELIRVKIQNLFCDKFESVYSHLVTLVTSRDILGREITSTTFFSYLNDVKLELRITDNDERVITCLHELNKSYRNKINPINGNIIYREVFDNCIEILKQEKNLIISGNAGCGKSACTEAIIRYCENEKIPHVAIKLDQKIPSKNLSTWSDSLGFPTTITYSLHKISLNESAIIILDQLDALRWTQANSAEAIDVCMQLIDSVKNLNKGRTNKILIVFVCRLYDLENDSNIKSLFEERDDTQEYWEQIIVDALTDEQVKEIVGEIYDQLTLRLKKLLKVPSNLYIWQHLDDFPKGKSDEYLTTAHLVDEWSDQICKSSISKGFDYGVIKKAILDIVDTLERIGRLYAPNAILGIDSECLNFLYSSEMVVEQNGKIGFAHQTILDCFIAQNMVKKYFEQEHIENIIGNKAAQTPSRRYQIQMFLQNLLEFDSNDFLKVGRKLELSDQIRYYIKYIFYEILGQIDTPDEIIAKFIIDNCENPIFSEKLLNAVIFYRKQYIHLLRQHGILERWLNLPEKRMVAIRLFLSISTDLDDDDILLIEKNMFVDKDEDIVISRLFFDDILSDSEKKFNLRLLFYKKYPELMNHVYINEDVIQKEHENHIIKFLSHLLKIKRDNPQFNYSHEESLILLAKKIIIDDEEFVFNSLFPYLPQDHNDVIKGKWLNLIGEQRSVERAIVELMKKSVVAICNQKAELFWEIYMPLINKNCDVYNEILLTGLESLPEPYSNQVIQFLYNNLDCGLIDNTSGTDNKLAIAKRVIIKHASTCDDDKFKKLENSILKYKSPNMVKLCKYKIEYSKKNGHESKYLSFWGELQFELLPCLPVNRIQENTKNLIAVLNRRFEGVQTYYHINYGHSGWVRSPVANKKISIKQWKKIITNKELKPRGETSWKNVPGGFIESSISAFSSDFSSAVSQQPEKMINMVLANAKDVLPEFVESVYSGLVMSKGLNDVKIESIIQLFSVFKCDLESNRALYFCSIIEKINAVNWPKEIRQILKNITLNHRSPELDKPGVTSVDDSNMKSAHMLESNALNCIRGQGARAIGHLISENEKLFEYFRNTIDNVVIDENPAVRFAALFALWPVLNIDRKWAIMHIITLFESDIRLLIYPDARRTLFVLYHDFKTQILAMIEKCYNSDDEDLIRIGCYCICEFYIQYKEFSTIIMDGNCKSSVQINAILEMAVQYLKSDKYREEAQKIILYYKNTSTDVEIPLSYMFDEQFLEVNRDVEFLKTFLKTKMSRFSIRAFLKFLERNAISILDFADILIQQCENILSLNTEELQSQWGLVDEVSKLIIKLYDETANSTSENEKMIALKCMDLWDIMFERQLGVVRDVSRKLMER